MLRNIAVLAIGLVAANALSLEKCKPKGGPAFVDKDGYIEEPLVGGDPATWGPAGTDAEKALDAFIPALLKGEGMTQGEAEAALGGVVEELVEEVATAGGEQAFEKNGPKKEDPKDSAAENFIKEAGEN